MRPPGGLVLWSALFVVLLLGGCRSRREVDLAALLTPMAQGTVVVSDPVSQTASSTDLAPTETPTFRVVEITPPEVTPTRVPPEATAISYTVRAGDTLSRIALAYGTTVEMLVRINGLASADQIAVGQVLKVALEAEYTGPSTLIIPDSELVYGPGYRGFDVAAAITGWGGYLETYEEAVQGRTMTGAEIVQLVADQYSVGPRVLLTLLELRGGWVTQDKLTAEQLTWPLGYVNRPYWEGLYRQLCLAADALNTGFYGWWEDAFWLMRTTDGVHIQFSPQLSAGTAGVQFALASTAPNYEAWSADLQRFDAIYRQFFGDPFAYAFEPLIPATVRAPALVLPWSKGETWYLTGGPHPGWGTLGAFSALDFVTEERHLGCAVSQYWVTAAADGRVLFSEDGMVLQELDDDGFVGTGWVLLYMHIASDGRVPVGTLLKEGDPIGHPSCEGGVSSASHLHFARRYNGVWIAADDPYLPMSLSGWIPRAGAQAYQGTLVRGSEERRACECWEPLNAVQH